MKKSIITFLVLAFTISTHAQVSSKLPPLDKSPMDMSYYPDNYPLLKIQDKMKEPVVMRLIYSRPQLAGRKAFGELRELGKVWRLGANEATELEFFKDVKINNKKVKKGRYTIYSIPYSDKWTFILNRETDTWGDFKYDSLKDVLRIELPVNKIEDKVESLTMLFEKSAKGADLVMYWDDTKVVLPIAFF